MKTIVVDTSVSVKWINQIDEQFIEESSKLLRDAQIGSVTLLAPELSKYEIGNALLKKNLDATRANAALGTVYQLPITFISQTESLAQESYKIAQNAGVTYYDASFMALAKQEHATLVTDNPKHQGKSTDITVVPLKDY